MLSPEVLKFPVPDHKINIEAGNLNDIKSNLFVKNKINNHYFNKMISIILPDTNYSSSELVGLLPDSDSYLIRSVSLHEFINRQFIDGFIKRGTFYGITQNKRIDTDDCVAVTPCGILYISVNKETFQTLGVEGKLSIFSKKHRDRYKSRKFRG